MKSWAVFLALLALPPMHAQDTRNVVEPKFPPACEVLTARLAAPGGALSDADERRPDTARLQKAIDGCAPGKAVELKPAGDRRIFSADRSCSSRASPCRSTPTRRCSPPAIRATTI